jgi:hypothetical protein
MNIRTADMQKRLANNRASMYENLNEGLETKPCIRQIITGPSSTKYQSSNTSMIMRENTMPRQQPK